MGFPPFWTGFTLAPFGNGQGLSFNPGGGAVFPMGRRMSGPMTNDDESGFFAMVLKPCQVHDAAFIELSPAFMLDVHRISAP